MAHGTFAAAINCIDGRTIRPVMNWIQINHSIDFVDMVTEPGPDKLLSEGTPAQIADVKTKVLVSVNAHGSKLICIAGHHDCAANSVSEEEHRRLIRQAAQVIAAWGLSVQVIGLWVNQWWQVEVVCDTGA